MPELVTDKSERLFKAKSAVFLLRVQTGLLRQTADQVQNSKLRAILEEQRDTEKRALDALESLIELVEADDA